MAAATRGEGPRIICDEDGAAAVARADATGGRTVIWVGGPEDPELAEFAAEIAGTAS